MCSQLARPPEAQLFREPLSHSFTPSSQVVMSDVCAEELTTNAAVVAALAAEAGGTAEDVLAVTADVSKLEDIEKLKAAVFDKFGECAVGLPAPCFPAQQSVSAR